MTFLSRARLKPGMQLGELARLLPADAYAEHKLLWQWFSRGVEARDFLFRREQQGHCPQFYVVSRCVPNDPGNHWDIDCKPFAPRLAAGERLTFVLRANPVRVRKISDDPAIKTRRRDDVVADLKKRRYSDREQRPPMGTIVQEAGETWLSERASSCGFELEAVYAEGYRQHRLYKRGRGEPITLSTVDFSGRLRITDAARFTERLFRGIGPAKAFGCGLLLVRRV